MACGGVHLAARDRGVSARRRIEPATDYRRVRAFRLVRKAHDRATMTDEVMALSDDEMMSAVAPRANRKTIRICCIGIGSALVVGVSGDWSWLVVANN